MLFGQKRLKTNFLPNCFKSLLKPLQTLFLGSFYLYRKFEQIWNFDQNSKGLVHAFWPKTAKNQLSSKLLQILLKPLQTLFLGSFYLYRKFEQIWNFDQTPKGLVHPCWPKTVKNQLSSKLLQITFKTTPNIISRLLLPIQKVWATLKFSQKSQGVSPSLLAKNG